MPIYRRQDVIFHAEKYDIICMQIPFYLCVDVGLKFQFAPVLK